MPVSFVVGSIDVESCATKQIESKPDIDRLDHDAQVSPAVQLHEQAARVSRRRWPRV